MPKEYTDEELQTLKEKFRVQMVIQDGVDVCPRCELDADTKRLSDEVTAIHTANERNVKRDVLHTKSIFQDETLKQAKFDTYALADDMHEARTNLQHVLQLVERYQQGHQFNVMLAGNVGVGKSHLAVSMLKALRSVEISCLFIDTAKMFDLIYDSFNNKESKYTPNYFTELAASVDFLVLDDIGAETGDINTDRHASDYTSRILRSILNGRQDKSTIFTTNLSSEKIMQMYDPKLVDRMLKNIEIIKFNNTLSYRSKNAIF